MEKKTDFVWKRKCTHKNGWYIIKTRGINRVRYALYRSDDSLVVKDMLRIEFNPDVGYNILNENHIWQCFKFDGTQICDYHTSQCPVICGSRRFDDFPRNTHKTLYTNGWYVIETKQGGWNSCALYRYDGSLVAAGMSFIEVFPGIGYSLQDPNGIWQSFKFDGTKTFDGYEAKSRDNHSLSEVEYTPEITHKTSYSNGWYIIETEREGEVSCALYRCDGSLVAEGMSYIEICPDFGYNLLDKDGVWKYFKFDGSLIKTKDTSAD